MKAFLFLSRIMLAWSIAMLLLMMTAAAALGPERATVIAPLALLWLLVAILRALVHVRRVGQLEPGEAAPGYGSTHRRRIELPMPAGEAFDLVLGAVRELPRVELETQAREGLLVRAQVPRSGHALLRLGGERVDTVQATLDPGEGTCRVNLMCEPLRGAWAGVFDVDFGANLANADAVSRSISRRVEERRRHEAATMRGNEMDRALAEARLSLLQAQIEPHFIYNTLASAQLMTRSHPEQADRMLGNLITYLRTSMPRNGQSLATLGDELVRANAYLDIQRIRMGERLAVRIDVPADLMATAVPPMMLQALVENAIKHGLEPQTGGGTIWVLARPEAGQVRVTVADDGVGMAAQAAGSGRGTGLANVRERLRLIFGDRASLALAANFPHGLAATLTLPA